MPVLDLDSTEEVADTVDAVFVHAGADLENKYVAMIDSIVYLTEFLALFLIGRWAFKISHRSIVLKDELTKKDNTAFALAFVGFLSGVLVIIGSAIEGPSDGLWYDVHSIAHYGLVGIVLLIISQWFCNRWVFNKVNLSTEILRDQNTGAGAIQAAFALAGGLIASASISGDNHHVIPDWASVLLYWSLGMVILWLALKIYFGLLKFNVQDQIERDNVAVGIASSGLILAVAILIQFALRGDFHGWDVLAEDLLFDLGLGLILLPFARLIADKILLPGQSLSDELLQDKPNIGAGFIEAFSYIGMALAITWCL